MSKRFSWGIAAASCAGRRSDRDNRGNFDAWGAASLSRSALLLVAADGAGSAAAGGAGATAAVQETLLVAAERFGSRPQHAGQLQAGLQRLLLDVRSRLESLAGPRPLGDYATTLLCAVVTPCLVGAAQIGDGAIVAVEAGAAPQLLTRPARGRYLGETAFITSESWERQADARTFRLHELAGVALLTDGLEPVALEMAGGRPFAPFFAPLFAFASSAQRDPHLLSLELGEFLRSERIASRVDDDRTLLLAAPKGASYS